MLDLISDKDKGNNPADKLRLFIIWFLSIDQDINSNEWQQFLDALSATGVDVTCLPYIRQ